jgi:hypothetical protein
VGGLCFVGHVEREGQQLRMVAEAPRQRRAVARGRDHGVAVRQHGFGEPGTQAAGGAGDQPDAGSGGQGSGHGNVLVE